MIDQISMTTTEVKKECQANKLKHPEKDSKVGECSNSNPIESSTVDQQKNEDVTNTSQFPNFSMGDVTVPENTNVQNLHIGPKSLLVGPVCIHGVTIENIAKVEKCICGEGKINRHKAKNATVKGRINSIQNVIGKYWSVSKCAILAISIVLVQFLIIFCYWVTAKNARMHVNHICLSDWKASEVFKNFTILAKRDDLESSHSEFNGKLYIAIRNLMNFEHDCTVDCRIPVKSHVRFVMPRYQTCLNYITCRNFFIDEFNSHRSLSLDLIDKYLGLNDIYYNYFTSSEGIIYEGRALNCPFDEPFLPRNYSSTIVIAIPYYLGDFDMQSEFERGILPSVLALLSNLKATGVLIKNPTIELPIVCDNTTYLSNILSLYYNLSFYENDLFLNTDFHTQLKTLLFLSDQPISNTAKYISISDFNFYFHPYRHPFMNFNNSDKAMVFIDILSIRYTFIELRCPSMMFRPNYYEYPELKSRLMTIKNDSCENGINYFIYLPRNVVIQGVPIDCSLDFERNRRTVRIEIIGDYDDTYPTEHTSRTIEIFNRVFSPIAENIKEKVNYKGVHFEVPFDYFGPFVKALLSVSKNLTIIKDDVKSEGPVNPFKKNEFFHYD